MIRTLLIITGASLVLCAAAFAGASAIGGNDLARHGWTWTFHDSDEDRTVRFERGDDSPPVTRNLAWTGGDRLQVEIPGDVVYIQGETASVVVTGQSSMVDRVRLEDGRLIYDEDQGVDHVVFGWNIHDRLKVTVTAPSVTRFDVETSADLTIRDYDQPELFLALSGSGDVEAEGRTRSVTIEVSGSGDADLARLETVDARLDISGSGDVRVGPTGSARVEISGSGDARLTRRPAQLEQDLSGSGDVDQY